MAPAFFFAAAANAVLSFAGALFLHLPGFLQELGAGEARIGRIMAAQAVGAIVAWPFVGRAMDTRGRRVVIRLGVALFVAASGMYLLVHSLGPLVYAIRLLDGVASIMWYTALFTYAADLVPQQRRTEGLALFGVSGLVPIGIGAQSGDVILANAAYRELFLTALALAAAGSILCLPLPETAAARAGAARRRQITATILQPNLIPVWLATFTFFIAVLALFSFMKTFVIATGMGTVGRFFMTYAGTAVALRIGLGWVPDRIGAERMAGISMGCYASGFVALSLAHSSTQVIAAGVLCGVGHGYAFPVLLSLVVGRARPEERGVATAFFTTLDWASLFIAGPLVGYAIETNGYSVTFAGIAVLLAAGIIGFYVLDKRHVRIDG